MEDPLGLGKFKIQISKLAPLERFRTRAGFELSYRLYPAWSENLMVLFHGIGADSRYLCFLASAIAQEGLATVVTPDLRGHGASAGADDDIGPHQLEEDWEELLVHLKGQRAVGPVVLSGHSLGGALALKILSSPAGKNYRGAFVIAPYLPPAFQAHREGYGGWIVFDETAGVVRVQKPVLFQTDEDKLSYSRAYMRAVSPDLDFRERLAGRKAVLVIGGRDQVFIPERYRELLASQVAIDVFPNENHFSILAQTASVNLILDVLKETGLLS